MDLLGGKYDTTSSRRMVNKELKRIRKEIKSLENSRVQLLKEKYVLELSDTDFNEINSSIITKMSELKNELRKQTDKELLLDKRSDWIDWVGLDGFGMEWIRLELDSGWIGFELD